VSKPSERAAAARVLMQEPQVLASAASASVYPSSFDGAEDRVPSVTERRRRRRRTGFDPAGVASLMIDEDGVLFWSTGDVDGLRSGRHRMRRGVPEAPAGEIVELYHYDKLDPNEVNALLITKDAELTPRQGLWRLELDRGGTPAQSVQRKTMAAFPSGKKKRLLFIHGTFSKTEAFFDGMQQAPGGRACIAALFDRYDEVLAFDHPTLSASPAMNAFDLARSLARADGPMDIIAHSRGGLVTRWLLEGFGMNGRGPYRAVLVGSPLGGTSLASPPRLKGALDVLTNIGAALKAAGAAAATYVPFLVVPLALVRIASSVLTIATKTPIVDAAVSMIPGLQGQARIADHPELTRLRAVRMARPPQYFVVQSNFETEDPGWKFWKYFRKDQMLDTGADLVFDGPNDLVVDTRSMSDLPTHVLPASSVQDYGTTPVVHHTNYFSQQTTLDFVLSRLA
jgi:hypothetical protein